MTSFTALGVEPECQSHTPPQRHQIFDFLRALTLASDGSGYDAPYDIDLGIRDGIGGRLAAEPILLLAKNAAYCYMV